MKNRRNRKRTEIDMKPFKCFESVVGVTLVTF